MNLNNHFVIDESKQSLCNVTLIMKYSLLKSITFHVIN